MVTFKTAMRRQRKVKAANVLLYHARQYGYQGYTTERERAVRRAAIAYAKAHGYVWKR